MRFNRVYAVRSLAFGLVPYNDEGSAGLIFHYLRIGHVKLHSHLVFGML